MDLIVFWGSQSGRGERLAGSFARDCNSRFGLRAAAADLDDYDHEHLIDVTLNKTLVFIVSTFGEGDPTDNSINFLSAIARLGGSSSDGCLRDLQYLAFGLGNKNYKHYNKIIDVIDERFQTLGATRLGEVGRADEAKGNMATEEDFMEWKETALILMGSKLGVEERDRGYTPEFEIVAAHVEEHKVYLGERTVKELYGGEKVMSTTRPNEAYAAPVASTKVLVGNPDRHCIHVAFDLSRARLKYQSGDHLAVWPVNPDEEVERLCRLLGLSPQDRETAIEIKSKVDGKQVPIPSPTTRETILRYYLEVCGPASRDLLRLLIEYCPSEEARNVMVKLTKDKDAYKSQVSARCLTIGKVMQLAGGEAVWTTLPFSLFVECLGKLQPRYYSIASSPSVTPLQPEITVSVTSKVLESSTPGAKLLGVASNYLLAVKSDRDTNEGEVAGMKGAAYHLDGPRSKLSGGKVLVHLRRSTFKLPANSQRPIIMVASGTGIAPFRAFVQERAAMAAHGLPIGPMFLIFGCRAPSDGFLYKDEWESYQRRLPCLEVVTAFSRHGDKKYVQDRLFEAREKIVAHLDNDASFYICGSADMARGVREKLAAVFSAARGWSDVQAERYIMGEMKQARRLQEDVWTS